MPKVRDSFAHQFALEGVDTEVCDQESDHSKNLLQLAPSRKYRREEPHFRHIGSISLRNSISHLLEVDSDFPMPKVRDSFAHQFALEGVDTEVCEQESDHSKNLLQLAPSRKYRREEPHFRHIGSISLRNSISHLLEISDRTRQSVTNSLNFLPHFYRSSGSLHPRRDALPKSQTMSEKFLHATMRTKQMLYNENGDLSRPSDSAPKKDLKQGEIDIRALQQKRHLAEITRTRIEEDMRENHPLFDRPLFFIGRASRLREFCKKVGFFSWKSFQISYLTARSCSFLEFSACSMFELIFDGIMCGKMWEVG
ncbi:hypothetical protein COOONC_12200 [Cooperia oncophora]